MVDKIKVRIVTKNKPEEKLAEKSVKMVDKLVKDTINQIVSTVKKAK